MKIEDNCWHIFINYRACCHLPALNALYIHIHEHIYMCIYTCRFLKTECIFGRGNKSILLFKDSMIFLFYRLQLVHWNLLRCLTFLVMDLMQYLFFFLFSFKPSVYFILMYHAIIPCNYGHPVFQDKQLTPGDT